ncbi:MAG: response regulator [Candidatus Hydrogenedentes bacterium]|nr:response regulator [Candidatus Hydrogenedentota bacterium]
MSGNETSTTEATARKKHVLFVDDEPNFLAGLRRLLRGQREPWELFFAGGADEAIELTRRQRIDTIVTDVSMPRKTGFDLLQELQADESTRDIPVIILTGNAESHLKRRGLDLGATDLLNKPVNLDDLTARVRSALRIKEYGDRLRNQNAILEQKVRERTAAHVLRVADCSCALARALALSPAYREALSITSPLHDIGKIGVPDGILFKPGRLTPDERSIMQRHCEIGAAILLEEPHAHFGANGGAGDAPDGDTEQQDNGLRQLAAEIAMTHHERWDGEGYPRGLARDEIPISGQIVAIADVYDALRSVRAYKPAFSVAQTLDIMRQARGTHFAPDVFDAFERIVEEFEAIRQAHAETETMVGPDETSSIR